jgi:hypothetical protein
VVVGSGSALPLVVVGVVPRWTNHDPRRGTRVPIRRRTGVLAARDWAPLTGREDFSRGCRRRETCSNRRSHVFCCELLLPPSRLLVSFFASAFRVLFSPSLCSCLDCIVQSVSPGMVHGVNWRELRGGVMRFYLLPLGLHLASDEQGGGGVTTFGTGI